LYCIFITYTLFGYLVQKVKMSEVKGASLVSEF